MRVFGIALALAVLTITPPARAQSSDALMWARAKTCADYLSFASNYPGSRYVAQAKTKITEMKCVAAFVSPAQPARTPPADSCFQARQDWPAVEGTSSLEVARAYMATTPAACQVWREKGKALVATLEGKAREAAAKQAAVDAAARAAAEEKHKVDAAQAAVRAKEEPWRSQIPTNVPESTVKALVNSALVRAAGAESEKWIVEIRERYEKVYVGRNLSCKTGVLLTPPSEARRLHMIATNGMRFRRLTALSSEFEMSAGTAAECYNDQTDSPPTELLPWISGPGAGKISALSVPTHVGSDWDSIVLAPFTGLGTRRNRANGDLQINRAGILDYDKLKMGTKHLRLRSGGWFFQSGISIPRNAFYLPGSLA